VTYSFRSHCGSEFDSASNRNEYQESFLGGEYGRCVGLTILPPSCADFLEIPGASSWNPKGLSRPVVGKLYLYLLVQFCKFLERWVLYDVNILFVNRHNNTAIFSESYFASVAV
jgi:hypothetical protein